MPVGKDSKIVALIDAFKEWLPSARQQVGEWAQACRAEPILIWHTPAVRYTVYVLAFVILAYAVSCLVWLASPGGPEPVPYAETADFHVICTDPSCGKHFVINREFDFDDFPVECIKCKKRSAYHAFRCFSETCQGKWVVPKSENDKLVCPYCGEIIAVDQ